MAVMTAPTPRQNRTFACIKLLRSVGHYCRGDLRPGAKRGGYELTFL